LKSNKALEHKNWLKGVSDVATAVTKTTGITKQEGSGNIFL
jgi:hypothetical protein